MDTIRSWKGLPATVILVLLLVSACGSSQVKAIEPTTTMTQLALSPSERPWMLAVPYTGVLLIDHDTELTAGDVSVKFLGEDTVVVVAGGCALGTGTFSFLGGRLTSLEFGADAVACQPANEQIYTSVQQLLQSEPRVTGSGNLLRLEAAAASLDLEAADSVGGQSIVSSDELFVGVSTSIAGLDPSTLRLTSPVSLDISSSVVAIQLSTCEIIGAFSYGETLTTLVVQERPDNPWCQEEKVSASDHLAQRFFLETGQVVRNGSTLIVSNAQGEITFAAR